MRAHVVRTLLVAVAAATFVATSPTQPMTAQTATPAKLATPEEFFGFKIGADNKLARWDKIVDYMRQVAGASDRVRFRELGKTTNDNPFIALEISAPETLKNLDRYKQLQRKLYFQGGAPTDPERDEIFRQGKLVIAITCSIHATEIGASQMAVELVHRLATDNSPGVKKILDNVIFVLVPSLNPDGQIMVTDWFNKNLGTPFENSQLPYLYHPYVGHDNNRDMYMFTQKESQLTAKLLWSDWFPTVWLDEHQMGSTGARIFVMPATDPINPNVHPLIYRWNGILGQSQAAALEAAGKEGIIYNSTYTNFWQGAMAWSGWWHNQIGLLTEVASARLAAPIDQQRAVPGSAAAEGRGGRGGEGGGRGAEAGGRGGEGGGRGAEAGGRGGEAGGRGTGSPNAPLAAPTDINPRTEYPRPWMGGRWTLGDIVDYELIATMALLDTVADRREALMRQIYEVNRDTVERGKAGDPAAILIPVQTQHDPHEAGHLVEKLQMAGVEVFRAAGEFEAEGTKYAGGTFVIPMTQVFARYAKDMLEKQTYPEVRRSPTSPPEAPYDVTAWSLGMLLGLDHVVVRKPLADSVKLDKVTDAPKIEGRVTGNGPRFVFDYRGPDAARAVNALLAQGARVTIEPARDKSPARIAVTGVARKPIEAVASQFGFDVRSEAAAATPTTALHVRAPRIAMYQPWAGGNMDEGWTRWVLEQYGFKSVQLHNDEVRAGALKDKYDVIILPDQNPQQIINGATGNGIRPEYRGGIGTEGVTSLKQFVDAGGTLVTLGAASGLAIEQFSVPVRDLKRGLTRDQHFAPGTILRIEVDSSH
ncbi:MAG TPA: M14 metallopeptidase family protein, partial [Vicinamibacterales bacterium]|nr:M14 metallopeptidase family protein [Vicinamibacterales bacterium]